MVGKAGRSGGNLRAGPLFVRKPKIGEDLLSALRDGMSYAGAAHRCGLNEKTVEQWFQRGREGEHPYKRFYRRCMAAAAEVEQKANRAIVRHFEEKPELALKYLRNTRRRHYHEREDITASEGIPVKVVEYTADPARPDIAASEAERRKSHGSG